MKAFFSGLDEPKKKIELAAKKDAAKGPAGMAHIPLKNINN